MEYEITAIWSIIEICGVFTFLTAFLSLQKRRKHCVLSGVLLFAIMYTYSVLGLGSFVKQLVTLVMAIAWSFYLFSAKWHWHVLCVLLAYAFLALFDVAVTYGTSAILGTSYADLVWRKFLYTAVVTLGKMIYLLFAYMLYRIRKPYNKEAIQNKWTLLTALFPIASTIVVVMIFYTYQQEGDLSLSALLSSSILFIANIAILYIIRIMERNTAKEKEFMLLNQQMEIQTESITTLEKSYRAQRTATHEFLRHMQAIHDLLVDKQPESALDYIKEIQGVQTVRIFCVNSRHSIIDAILNQKYQVAKEQSIEMEFEVNDLSCVTVDTKALVVLLSNLLDNAIEACQKLSENRLIRCRILVDDELYISIRNTSPPVTIINGTVPTTKTPREEHGYGLITVRHILTQLHAEHTIHYENGFFQFAAEIPNATK